MPENFDSIEVLNNQAWNKTLAYIDSFYINSALVSVYNKKGAEFINIQNTLKRMYEDIYNEKIKIPEIVDDNWVSATLARYIEQDIKNFESNRHNNGEFVNKELIDKILYLFSNCEIKINFEGLIVNLNLTPIEKVFYKCEVLTALRGKLSSKIVLEGKEINFIGTVVSAKKLQRHEVLTLQIFLTLNINGQEVKIIASKFGDYLSKIFIDDGYSSTEHSFGDYNIKCGSFDINRGV